MRINFNRLILKQDIDRIHLLHWAHFLLASLSILIELFNGLLGWILIPKVLVFLLIYRLFFRMVKELYYTFWTFSAGFMIYFIWGMMTAEVAGLFYTNFLAAIILAVEMYILYSPIYYPQVSWWEYDFRYRHDLKISTEVEDKVFEGRLTDLRRDAGCLSFFENFEIGKTLEVQTAGDGQKITLRAEIISKRQYSLGRPKNYGVRFHFDNAEERKEFGAICHFWSSERKSRVAQKFDSLKDS